MLFQICEIEKLVKEVTRTTRRNYKDAEAWAAAFKNTILSNISGVCGQWIINGK